MNSFYNLQKLLTTTSKQEWINMTYEHFLREIVEPLNMIGHESRRKVIETLDYPQFKMLTSKCWEEQDKQPMTEPGKEDYENETQFEEAYYETLPIVLLLEDILSIRLTFETLEQRKHDMTKQLGILNLILKPHLLDDVAEKINKKKK